MRYVLILTMISSSVFAKDFGVRGPIFPIVELNPIEVIEKQLGDLDPSELEKLLLQSADEGKLFVPIRGWVPTTQPRKFQYDPTYTIPQDIKDHKGRVLFKQGEKVNPLTLHPMEKTLLFIDGREAAQIHWALDEHPQPSKVILVAGSPNQLMKIHKRSFYFDQDAHLLKAFDIKQIPAAVTITGGKAWVEEINLEGQDG